MKVCKIVLNPVSQDARVLKQATALTKGGHTVVVIGIQDNNIHVPLTLSEQGFVIHRVAWKSDSLRPMVWFHIIRLVLLLAILAGGAALAQWSITNTSTILGVVRLDYAIFLAFGLLALLGVRRLYHDYRRRRATYDSVQKAENNEFLKYEDMYLDYLNALNASGPGVASSRRPRGALYRALARRWKARPHLWRDRPRPLMGGLLSAATAANFRRWKVVFSRENAIYRVLEQEQPEVVHAHDLNALPVAARYAKKHGCKLVFDAHEIYDHLAQADDAVSGLNKMVLKKYGPRVDLFITINGSIARYYEKAYPTLPPALIIKNATVPAGPIVYDGRLHAAADLSPDRKILIYQGGFAAKRGLMTLLAAAEYLDPQWCLVFMGWGRLEEELRRTAKALALRDEATKSRIRFVPKVEQAELPLWTAGASLGVIPYENTGLNHWFCNPNKLWEYPNAGVPILASPFPELRSVIETNKIGWLLPENLTPRDIAGVVNAVTTEQLANVANNCRAFIARDNWTIYASRLTAAYEGLK